MNNPRCYNCQYSSPATDHKSLDEHDAVMDFVHCAKTNCFMYRNDYCTSHPDIVRAVMRAKMEAKNDKN